MKITIKNQEYKLLHNIPKGTRVMYNDEECVKAEKANMLVGIETGRIYMLPPTKKIYMNNERKRVSVKSLLVGNFFIYNKQLYILIDSDYPSEVFNLNTREIEFINDGVEVELVQDKDIQIKVK